MDTSLRIPVTSEQKAVIDEATADEPEGMAAWARAVLLEAAVRSSILLLRGIDTTLEFVDRQRLLISEGEP